MTVVQGQLNGKRVVVTVTGDGKNGSTVNVYEYSALNPLNAGKRQATLNFSESTTKDIVRALV